MKYKYESFLSNVIELEIPENEVELHDKNQQYIKSLCEGYMDKYAGTRSYFTIMHMVIIQLGMELQRQKSAVDNHTSLLTYIRKKILRVLGLHTIK